MRMYRAQQLFDRRLEPERDRRLGDEFRRARANHVDPQQLVVLLLCHDLDQALGLAGDLRPSEHSERKRSDAYVESTLDGGFLSEADAADFRLAVRAGGNLIVVD